MKVLEIVLQFIGSACSCCNAYHVCHLDSSSLPVLGFFLLVSFLLVMKMVQHTFKA